LKLEKYLDQLRSESGFIWVSVINNEGLALCQSGTEEPFELAALLPSWICNGKDIARAAQMESGMGLICLVPKRGSHALLLRNFEVNNENYILLIATSKMPPKIATTLNNICHKLTEFI